MWEPGPPTGTPLDQLFPVLRERMPDLCVRRGWLANPRPGDNDEIWTFWLPERRDSVQIEPAHTGWLIEGDGDGRRREVVTVGEAADLISRWVSGNA